MIVYSAVTEIWQQNCYIQTSTSLTHFQLMTSFVPYLTIAITVLAIIIGLKTVHFYRHIKRKKLKYWFYFSHNAIINSSNSLSEKAKKFQNKYTLLLTIFSIVTLILLMLEHRL